MSKAYSVDNVPVYWLPLFGIYGYGGGLFFYGVFLLTRVLTKVTIVNKHLLSTYPNHIICIWHEALPMYFTVFNRVKHYVWMNHPVWYMKPIHVMMKLTGVTHICLGSSGHGGKAALENVVQFMQEGFSTVVAVDGPNGPAKIPKMGAMMMSQQTDLPIITLKFTASYFIRNSDWDRKIFALPFSRISVEVGEPLFAKEMDETALKERLIKQLG